MRTPPATPEGRTPPNATQRPLSDSRAGERGSNAHGAMQKSARRQEHWTSTIQEPNPARRTGTWSGAQEDDEDENQRIEGAGRYEKTAERAWTTDHSDYAVAHQDERPAASCPKNQPRLAENADRSVHRARSASTLGKLQGRRAAPDPRTQATVASPDVAHRGAGARATSSGARCARAGKPRRRGRSDQRDDGLVRNQQGISGCQLTPRDQIQPRPRR